MALIDRIKHDAATDDLLVWKYPREDIRIGAQLIVNQSQEAVFVKGGQVLDLFGPGTHTLTTANIPLLRKLVNLPFGGQSPFSAEIWYVNKTVKGGLKWGTKAPIPVIDPKYNFPVSVRAYGKWGLRIADSRSFIAQVVGSQLRADSSRVEEYFGGEIVQRLSDALARFFVEQGVSIFEANAKLNELSRFTTDQISPKFARFGIEIVTFNVENISLPDDEKRKFQEILGRRMEIEQVSEAQVGQAYVTMRSFDVLEKAAQNSGGAAGGLLSGGIGLGMGLAGGVSAGQQLGKALNFTGQEQAAKPDDDAVARLQQIKRMLDAGLITEKEFNTKKQQILDSI